MSRSRDRTSIGAAVAPAAAPRDAGISLWTDAWRRMRKNRLAVAGGWLLAVVTLLALLAPALPGLPDPNAQDLALGAVGPRPGHWFGTDILGRDLLSRVLYGGQISLLVGLVATLVSFLIGVTWGAVAGYAGGRTDELMMRFVDVLYSLPYMFLVILLLVFFSRSLVMLFVALGAVQWLTMARIVRGQVLSLKQREFVEAARAIGVGPAGIIARHLIPNALGPIIVYATLTVPSVMLQEAFLSFLGLGVQPPRASWGVLVNEGAGAMGFFPWLVVFPGVMLALTLASLNVLGDGLRDALDPHLRKE